jgi:hypothetical protein
MTNSTISRSPHARDASVPAVSAAGTVTTPGTGDDDPAHRNPRWWRRLCSAFSPQRLPHELQQAALERLLALLEAARADLSAGWVQGGWWTTPSGGGRQTLVTGLAVGPSVPERVGAVCLVGALIRAGSGQGGGSEIGRAIDVVYDALWESRDQAATTPGAGLIQVSSPQVRQARTQALTRWNDAQGRTSGEVVHIVDRAIARVIQDLATLPAPRVPVSAQADPAGARVSLNAG